jgi:hypothetical protein
MDGFSVNSHANGTLKRWHLWKIDLRFTLNSTPRWGRGASARESLIWSHRSVEKRFVLAPRTTFGACSKFDGFASQAQTCQCESTWVPRP